MEEKEFELRQASNEVTGAGYLQEIDLAYSTTENNVVIKGTVTMAVDEKRAFKLPIYARKKTKDGKDSKVFEYFTKLIEEKSTINSIVNIVKETGKDKKSALDSARKIFFRGSVDPYGFMDEEGNAVFLVNSKRGLGVTVRVMGDFEPSEENPFEPGIKFSCELFINSIKNEKIDDKDTGRGIMTATLPLYKNNVATLNLVILPQMRETAYGFYNPGDTARLYGEYNLDIEIIEEESQEVGWGEAPEKKITTKSKCEMVLKGGSSPYGAQNEKAYKKEDIDMARAEKIEKLQKDAEDYRASKENKTASAPAAKKGFKFE